MRVLESWDRVALHDKTDLPPNHPDLKQQQLLLRMWLRYRQVFQEQRTLLSNNDATSFSRRVAAAMARMPSLKEKRFADGYRGHDHDGFQIMPGLNFMAGLEMMPRLEIMVDREGNLDENKLMEGVADYFRDSVEHGDGYTGDVAPFNVLVEIPIAAHQAGVRFNTVDIRFWDYIDLTMFAKQSETRAALSLAFAQVRRFFLASTARDVDWDGASRETWYPAIVSPLGTRTALNPHRCTWTWAG